jgi:hypothetical protein
MKRVNVFITVDTETSIGGAFKDKSKSPVGADKRVFGVIDGREYGINLIMKMLDTCDFKGTFFVEPFHSFYFGIDSLKAVCEAIAKKNHDTQLHVHPNYLNFCAQAPIDLLSPREKYPDVMAAYSLEEQVHIVELGKKLLENCGVPSPLAFRAGCFGADQNTLTALARNDLKIDSSYCLHAIGRRCFLQMGQINDNIMSNGIIEFPITHFIDISLPGIRRYKPFDISSVSYREMKHVLEHAFIQGPKNVVIILHSFTFVKKKNIQYEQMTPDYSMINKFRHLSYFLNDNRDKFRVTTFKEYWHENQANPGLSPATTTFARPGAFRALARILMKRIGHYGYK